jgi:hypothetical protein
MPLLLGLLSVTTVTSWWCHSALASKWLNSNWREKNHHQLATNDLTTQIHSGGRLQSGLQTRMQNSESGVQGLRSPESPATLSGLISLYHFLESRTAELLQNNNSSSELGNCFLLDGYELGSSRPLGVLYMLWSCALSVLLMTWMRPQTYKS